MWTRVTAGGSQTLLGTDQKWQQSRDTRGNSLGLVPSDTQRDPRTFPVGLKSISHLESHAFPSTKDANVQIRSLFTSDTISGGL